MICGRTGSAFAALLASTGAALALFAPSAAVGQAATIVWQGETPESGTAFPAGVGRELLLRFEAAGPFGSTVRIGINRLPAGARLISLGDAPARAEFRWAPRLDQRGEWRFVFTAGTGFSSSRVVIRVHVGATAARAFGLSGRTLSSRTQHAALTRAVNALAAPKAGSRVVVRLRRVTPERVPHVLFLSSGLIDRNGRYWVRVPLPVLPNGRTGWIPRDALGEFRQIETHLVIERKRFRATLYKRGRSVFRTIVGVGEPHWPTPAGRFYVRERLTGFTDPIYGSLAFGTNGRSAVLTDWPGGGFIGIHGTNQPEILPGRVSHGCVRLRNQAIRRLDRLMPLGTPVTIR